MMIIYSDHRIAHRKQEVSTKHKISVAPIKIGSVMIWWYSCFTSFPQKFLSRMTTIDISFAIVAFFVFLLVLLLVADSSIVIDEPLEDIKLLTSMKTCPALWN